MANLLLSSCRESPIFSPRLARTSSRSCKNAFSASRRWEQREFHNLLDLPCMVRILTYCFSLITLSLVQAMKATSTFWCYVMTTQIANSFTLLQIRQPRTPLRQLLIDLLLWRPKWLDVGWADPFLERNFTLDINEHENSTSFHIFVLPLE